MKYIVPVALLVIGITAAVAGVVLALLAIWAGEPILAQRLAASALLAFVVGLICTPAGGIELSIAKNCK